MSDFEKIYHWANLILNPILLVGIFLPDIGESFVTVAMGWALLSAILNEQLRRWVLGAFGSLMGGIVWIACVGSLVGIMVFVVVATFAAMAGFLIILPLMWVMSLRAVLNAQRGLI